MTTTQSQYQPHTGRAVFSSAAAAYIADDDGRVLLVHHRKADRWVLPGGKVDWNESPARAAGREGTEELGVPVTVGRLLVFNWLTGAAELWPGAAANPYAYPCHMLTFHCEIGSTDHDRIEVPPDELLAWRWWDVDEAAASGLMEPYNARNLATATAVYRGEMQTAYLES